MANGIDRPTTNSAVPLSEEKDIEEAVAELALRSLCLHGFGRVLGRGGRTPLMSYIFLSVFLSFFLSFFHLSFLTCSCIGFPFERSCCCYNDDDDDDHRHQDHRSHVGDNGERIEAR